ncbi:Regulatory protein CI from bacteriophage origin [Escherichia coli]|uniref:Regulatory protein CI from bacteriophage origin n=1 Tax=Escherichia coli TaxID=562 RepID=A0A376UGH4_ECOLX|nr:Regulatory protein CI from bacteriophage origin [Escherichia coli]
MKGTIDPEDLVFVDVSVRTFNGDGIYAFTYSGTSHIKRLQKIKDTLTVISDNPAYKDWAIEPEDFEQLHIDGKVIVSWPMTLHRLHKQKSFNPPTLKWAFFWEKIDKPIDR